MLPDEALKSMKVMFATPCYISAVSMHYVTSIFELTHHCNRLILAPGSRESRIPRTSAERTDPL
jgi:hypothetical protein